MIRCPEHLEPREKVFLDALVAVLLACHGRHIRKVVLYGSKARGDHGPDSDTDLLVITAGSADLWAPLQEIAGDVEYEHGYPTLLSMLVYSEDEWEQSGRAGSPFHREVEREGVVIWADTAAVSSRGQGIDITVSSVRQQVVRFLEEGERALRSARALLGEGDLRSAVNRAYYACFYVASAALACRYIGVKKHKSAVDEFSSRIVRQGLVPRKAETVLRRLYRLREISDYDLARKLSPRDATKAVEDAADFCATVAEWCRGQLGKVL